MRNVYRTAAVLLFLTSAVVGQISYPDFSSIAGLDLNMNAAQSGNVLRVTPSVISQRGSVWTQTPYPVAFGFDMAFQFQITTPAAGGGDGMAFVIHNDPRLTTAIGNHASALGYGAFVSAAPGTAIANSLAIEIDTYSGSFGGFADSSGNEVSIHTGGTGDNSQSEGLSIGRVTPTANLSDGQPHVMRIRYVPGTLEVYVDDLTTPALSVTYDFATGGTHILPGTPVGGLNLMGGTSALIGFTASTGGAWENHDVLWWSTAVYETNDAAGSLDLDGLQSSGFSAAALSACVGQTSVLNSSGTGAYEVGIAYAPAVPGGVLTTAGGQIVNLNIFDPSLVYLNGGSVLSLAPHPGALSIPVTFPSPLVGSAQQMTMDAGHADGFQLSQVPEVTIVTGGVAPTPMTLTLGDDATVQVVLSTTNPCAATVSFYGTAYSDFYVNSNGDVSFTSGHTDFTATSGEWQTLMPRIGIQGDLEPNNFGTVTVTNNGSTGIGDWVTVAYASVTEWGTGGLGVTSYNIELHGPNGHEIGGFTTDGTWGVTPVVGGISLGAGGTHPPLVGFDALNGTGLQLNANATDSVIDENTGGMLVNTTGWTSLQFPLFDGSSYVVQ